MSEPLAQRRSDARRTQISGGAVHDRPFVRRDAFVGALSDGVESFAKCHQILPRISRRNHSRSQAFGKFARYRYHSFPSGMSDIVSFDPAWLAKVA